MGKKDDKAPTFVDNLRLEAIIAAGQGDADGAREALRVADEIEQAAKNNASRKK